MILSVLATAELPSVWETAWDLMRWHNPLGLLLSVIIGAALGSFANVVIYRLPRHQSLMVPASYCPHCRRPIPPWNNIPIFSYLLLRGKSACCGEPIPARYLIVELLGALISGSLYYLDGLNAPFLFQSAWMILLLILAVIDIEHYRLPNQLVAFGAVLSLLWMLIAPEQSWMEAAFGLLLAMGLGLGTALLSKLIKGQWGGMGDLKLMLVLGFTFGAGRFFFLYLVASLSAIFCFLSFRRRFLDHRLPMGPFFAVGAWVTIWSGGEILRWYLSLLG